MEDNTQSATVNVPPTTPEAMPSFIGQDQAALQQQFAAGASWFYWIAGLSLINSVIAFVGGNMHFIFGLGITTIADAIVLEANLGALGKGLAFAFAVLVAALVAAFGYLANQKMRWVFWVGMALYAIDALLLLLIQDWISAAVHGYVLYRMYGSVAAINQMNAMTE